MIETAILKLVWFLFVKGPLNIIAAFNVVLQYLTGGIINDMFFGSTKEFQWNNIPMQFWWFVIFAFCLFSLVFTIQIVILIFKEAIETKTKFVIALQNGLKAFIFMFLIPIFFFLANYIIQNIANTIINNFGANSNLADYLWHMGNPKWDGSPDGADPGYGAPSHIKEYNMLAQIFGTWFMLFGMFIIGLALIQKIFELFFLFVISPIVMIVMVIDNGKAAFTWKDMVIAKFLASTATLVGYYVFISAIQVLLASHLNGLNVVPIAKSLFIILTLCGGALATTGFSDMIANLIGESVGIKEGMASMQSTIKGGMMAMGAAKVTARASRFMKGKRARKLASSNLGGNDGAINPFDTDDDINSNQTSQLNFSNFRNANTGLASRTGILGLTGIGIGALAAVGAKGLGKVTAGNWKTGFKNLLASTTETAKKPLKRLTNSNIVKLAKGTFKNEQIKTSDKHIKIVTNETEKQKKLIKQYQQNNPNLVPKAQEKLIKLQSEKLNLYHKKAKHKIPNAETKHERKEQKRTNKNG